MLTKEKEVMMRAARNLHGSMLIEKVKGWKRGEIGDYELELASKNALQAVKDVEKMLEPEEKPKAPPAPVPEPKK